MYVSTLNDVKNYYEAQGKTNMVAFTDKLIKMFGGDTKLTTAEKINV